MESQSGLAFLKAPQPIDIAFSGKHHDVKVDPVGTKTKTSRTKSEIRLLGTFPSLTRGWASRSSSSCDSSDRIKTRVSPYLSLDRSQPGL
jgi:hypothetical protein